MVESQKHSKSTFLLAPNIQRIKRRKGVTSIVQYFFSLIFGSPILVFNQVRNFLTGSLRFATSYLAQKTLFSLSSILIIILFVVFLLNPSYLNNVLPNWQYSIGIIAVIFSVFFIVANAVGFLRNVTMIIFWLVIAVTLSYEIFTNRNLDQGELSQQERIYKTSSRRDYFDFSNTKQSPLSTDFSIANWVKSKMPEFKISSNLSSDYSNLLSSTFQDLFSPQKSLNLNALFDLVSQTNRSGYIGDGVTISGGGVLPNEAYFPPAKPSKKYYKISSESSIDSESAVSSKVIGLLGR